MLELISDVECEKIVAKATGRGDVKILKYNIEKFGSFLGFLGEYYWLKVNTVEGKLSFFVKSLPKTDESRKKMLVETGIFTKEVRFYEKILPSLTNQSEPWCPRGYLFRDDLLVLENLSLGGYKLLPFRFKFEKTHVEVTLKTLARFHASSIVFEQKRSIEDEFGEYLFEISIADIPWFNVGLKVCIIMKETDEYF